MWKCMFSIITSHAIETACIHAGMQLEPLPQASCADATSPTPTMLTSGSYIAICDMRDGNRNNFTHHLLMLFLEQRDQRRSVGARIKTPLGWFSRLRSCRTGDSALIAEAIPQRFKKFVVLRCLAFRHFDCATTPIFEPLDLETGQLRGRHARLMICARAQNVFCALNIRPYRDKSNFKQQNKVEEDDCLGSFQLWLAGLWPHDSSVLRYGLYPRTRGHHLNVIVSLNVLF